MNAEASAALGPDAGARAPTDDPSSAGQAGVSARGRAWRLRVGNAPACVAAMVLLLIVLAAAGAAYLPLPDPLRLDLAHKFRPPAWVAGGSLRNLLGTDAQGRDVLARIVFGARTSLIVGLAAVLLSSALGLVLGLLAGWARGVVDTVIMRVTDAMLAIPTMLFMLVVAMVADSGMGPLILVIALTHWVHYARLVRAETLRVRELEFVGAARIAGLGPVRIVWRHVLPNILASFVVVAALNVGAIILAESSLSFLGFGVQPPQISWGQMLSEGRQSLATSWWVATFPGLAITLTVLSVIVLGDWLRDYLDPRLS
ncbi:ABC transporter permease [Bordetella sp. N]|uniref:ABC transporter permease n=1 Tax=Bordetella sp. N TaxID=1746199 RepID=UPI0007104081|nr:ABC transporter permease [Bordetella sp. N]ALM81647.1 peptide ABC transporter permease [Bordetella sp. N]